MEESQQRMHSIEESTQAELTIMRTEIENQARIKEKEISKLKSQVMVANEKARGLLQEIGEMEDEIEVNMLSRTR
jgi:hypothetical protein